MEIEIMELDVELDDKKESKDVNQEAPKQSEKQDMEKSNEMFQMPKEAFEVFQKKLEIIEAKVDAICQLSEKDSCESHIPELIEQIGMVAKNQDRNDRQITQSLRENANFQIQVRQGMQKELDEYKRNESKEVFAPILEALATVYIEYQTVFNKKMKPVLNIDKTTNLENDLEKKENVAPESQDLIEVRKNLESMFEDIREILEDNGAEIVKSEVGEKRKPRLCKIIHKISTAQEEKHNTIAKSIRDGVVLGRQILCNEYVDVYIYDKGLLKNENIDDGQVAAQENNEE